MSLTFFEAPLVYRQTPIGLRVTASVHRGPKQLIQLRGGSSKLYPPHANLENAVFDSWTVLVKSPWYDHEMSVAGRCKPQYAVQLAEDRVIKVLTEERNRAAAALEFLDRVLGT